jgi:phage terminase large subunit
MAVQVDNLNIVSPKIRDVFFRQGEDGKAIYIPSRYKVLYGGRGSAKSWSFARLSVILSDISDKPLRTLCVREYQKSIRESIHHLLKSQIKRFGLEHRYKITDKSIRNRYNGSEYIFSDLKTNPTKIQSMEAIDVCIVSEAATISKESWRILTPTIRGEKGKRSEIWVEFNPRYIHDPSSENFIENEPLSCRRALVNWSDNPWLPLDLDLERRSKLRDIERATDPDLKAQLQDEYDHVWEGAYLTHSHAAIFRKRVQIHDFDEPAYGTRFYYGADWGFALDPTALIRCWITEHQDEYGEEYEELWVSHEAYERGVEIDNTPALFDRVPGARSWPIKADNARPETISYMHRRNFNISAAKKWAGSVEDGIEYLKGFRNIHIHTRCDNVQKEAKLYSYKTDRISGEILPIAEDSYNHAWDAIRYALSDRIRRRTSFLDM